MNFSIPATGSNLLELPLLLGHFVPWYTIRGDAFPLHTDDKDALEIIPIVEDMRHWNDGRAVYRRTHLHQPECGIYDSRDPAVIAWQIETALKHGVSGFIVNWYGKYSVENIITLHWLRGLREWNRAHPDRLFCYIISIDSQRAHATEGKSPVSMSEDFAYIRDHLITEYCLHRNGRVVLSCFPYENNCEEWKVALDDSFGRDKYDLIWMNETTHATACFPWIAPDDNTLQHDGPGAWLDPDNSGEDFLRNFYKETNLTGGAEYIMAGVWPGFNDQFVSWAWNPQPVNPSIRPRVICRETSRGNTLELTWLAYIAYLEQCLEDGFGELIPAPLVQIATWNDYAEASTVEPTLDYDHQPLQLCREYLFRARQLWNSIITKT